MSSSQAGSGALDPELALILARVKRAGHPEFWQLTPDSARTAYRKASRILDIAPVPMARVDNFSIHASDASNLPVRVYVPIVTATAGAARKNGRPLPVLVYFHGGGFTIGDLDTHDAVCRMFANRAQCVVVAVDYRRAPESKFPCAVNDAYDAMTWVHANAMRLGVDGHRLALAGDSAGGTLAAVSAMRARDDGWDPVLQLLIYPGVGAFQDTDSHRRLRDGYLLDATTIQWFFGHYLRSDADRVDWRFSPLDASPAIALAGLAPACVLVAGFDPLHDEAVAYADRLCETGVAVELLDYPGMTHGFFNFGGALVVARDAHTHAVNALVRAFSKDMQDGS